MINGASGIAMTDMFISATAALLIVLALNRPNPPQDLQIQTDMLGYCTYDAGEPTGLDLSAPWIGEATIGVALPADLASVPEALGLAPGLFYTLALMPDETGVLDSGCFAWVRDTIVRDFNRDLAEPPSSQAGSRAVFAVIPASGREGTAP